MSKSNQYLGHRWTHRSAFQKTTDYAKINLDDCTVSGEKSIAPDSDDELSDSRRATKRRRIEKLAEGYLEGEALFISSARPCPQALKRTIVRHKKSSTEPGFKLPELDTPKESAQIWEDVEDDAATLARLLRASRTVQERSEPVEAEPVEQVNVQASCKPQRRLRPAAVSSGPSEEALRQAAALRNRKGRVAVTGLITATEQRTNATTPASDPLDCINVTQSKRVLRSRHDKSEWLSRRKSRFSFGVVDIHDLADSASSPCIAPSSPQSASPRRRSTSSSGKKHGQGALVDARSPQKKSYHTAPEDTEVFEEPVEASPHRELEDLLQPRRPLDNVATPTDLPRAVVGTRADTAESNLRNHAGRVLSTTSTRGTSSEQPAPDHQTQSAPATRSKDLPELGKPAYLQAPSTQNGTTPLMYRKRTTRAKPSNEKQEATAQPPPSRRSTRRRVTFPSSEDVAASGPNTDDRQHVASHPPVLDLSFAPDYSFAPRLNMALVEEHQNKLLPTEPDSAGRTTSVRRALRRELRNSGAELTRCDGEPPTSSQVEDMQQPAPPQDSAASNSLGRTSEQNTSKTSDSERRQTWLGTQAMVARAERELFISPEKQRNTFTPINEQTPASYYRRTSEYIPLSQEREREPLKQLFQEPAPSTQAMLETFGGFSTVKKPRTASALKQAAEPTPIAMEKGKRPESRVFDNARRSSLTASSYSDKAKENRGSSLRFSISSLESPRLAEQQDQAPQEPTEAEHPPEASTTTSLATPARSCSAPNSRQSALKSPNPKPPQEERSQRKSSQAEAMFSQSQSMSLSEDLPTLSFFQAAQAPEAQAPAGFLRDPSNLSQTLDDLTRDVLGTTRDVEGLLSQ